MAPGPPRAEPIGADTSRSPFDAVVFAGGGCRCFWQAGFYAVAAPALGITPERIGAVSAGAALACAALLDATDEVLSDFKRRTARNPRNAYPRNLLRGDRVFPHESMYRGAVLTGLSAGDLRRLRGGPDLRILLARTPRWAGDRLGYAIGGFAYALDRYELRVHARWGLRFGFEAEVVSARECGDAAALTELILQSSCTPPLLPRYRRDGRLVLDGGLIDNAPADFVGDARSTLVLLTRDYPGGRIPSRPGRTYAAPSEPIAIVKWDYTSPDLIQQTFDLGRRDGEAFARRHSTSAPCVVRSTGHARGEDRRLAG